MFNRNVIGVLACACVPLSACHIPGVGGAKAPTGQVVAVVRGQEITLRELEAEMPKLNTTDPQLKKAVQDRVLDSMVARKILAQSAKKSGVDKDSDFVIAKNRIDEIQLVQSYEQNVAKSVPSPSADEIKQFVSANPDLFRAHKVFIVDQVRVQGQLSQQLASEIKPLAAIDPVIAVLNSHKIQFARGGAQLDSLQLGPEGTAQALKVGTTDLLLFPVQDMTLINKIVEVRSVQIPDDDANQLAGQFLSARHRQEAVQREMSNNLASAKGDVRFNDNYRPANTQQPKTAAPTVK